MFFLWFFISFGKNKRVFETGFSKTLYLESENPGAKTGFLKSLFSAQGFWVVNKIILFQKYVVFKIQKPDRVFKNPVFLFKNPDAKNRVFENPEKQGF